MTLLRVESFGHYGVSTSTTKASNKFYDSQNAIKWVYGGVPLTPTTVQGSIISGVPTGSGKAFKFATTTAVIGEQLDRLVMDGLTIADDLTDTIIIGFRMRIDSLAGAGGQDFLRFFSAINDPFENPHLVVTIGSGGEILFYDANGILHDTGLMVDVGTYNYFEIKVLFHVTDGTVQIGINEEYCAEVTGIGTKDIVGDTDLPGLPNFMIQNHAYLAISFGDFYMADDRGTVNNDFLGDILVVPTLPTEDVSVDFTPSSGGDNFAMVDDPQPAGPDEDTTINSTETLGATDLFRGDGTGFLTGYRVLGIQSTVRAKKLDSGYARLRGVIASGAPLVLDYGRDHYLSVSYRYYTHVFELNPDTELPFTISEANAAVFGYHLVDPNV